MPPTGDGGLLVLVVTPHIWVEKTPPDLTAWHSLTLRTTGNLH